MQNLKSRWMQISEDDREEILANRFGWMLKNLLEYGNTLVPNQAVRKNYMQIIRVRPIHARFRCKCSCYQARRARNK